MSRALARPLWLVALICGLILPIGRFLKTRDDSPPSLRIDPSELTFGEAWRSSDFHHTVLIRNENTFPITIDRFGTSCTCTRITPPRLTIPPKGSASVEVSIDLPSPPSSESRALPVDVELTAFSRELLAQPRWRISGSVRNPVTSDTVEIALPPLGDSSSEEPSFRFVVDSHLPLSNASATCRPEIGQVEVRQLDPGSNKLEVVVHPARDLRAGLHDLTFIVRGEDPLSRPSESSPIRCLLRIRPEIEVVPDVLWLGTHSVGKSISAGLSLRSISGGRLELLGVEADDDLDASTKPVDGPSLAVIVRQKITRIGGHKLAPSLLIRDESGRLHKLPFSIGYIGTPSRDVDP